MTLPEGVFYLGTKECLTSFFNLNYHPYPLLTQEGKPLENQLSLYVMELHPRTHSPPVQGGAGGGSCFIEKELIRLLNIYSSRICQ